MKIPESVERLQQWKSRRRLSHIKAGKCHISARNGNLNMQQASGVTQRTITGLNSVPTDGLTNNPDEAMPTSSASNPAREKPKTKLLPCNLDKV
jgi:hypothetical protein